MEKKAVGSPPLPPPPIILPTVKPEKLDTLKRSIISRRGFGSAGRCISLLTNHFKVSVKSLDEIFYQYNVRRASKAEVEEWKDWVTDALNATRAALNATRAVWKRELF
ncbi:Protein argonaute 4A [Camellia lanceoleosa]|uniref:Protein argonaute 4A n=1 Tax=Camellia lanceoleosa TaxID=1840588 RepID=A0ACC0J3Z5_9ERIC|nr:Protein argonaute 4A [Camellia lanceoleosa]